MTDLVDIANRALQIPGTRTSVTAAELANNSTNEAININLCLHNVRKQLLRMAPWNLALKTANLVYITSAPGTPENTSAATTLWEPGQPPPPWAYEYQYPVDCLRACWIIPATQTGFAGGVPITTAVTGGAASFWQGPPVKFQVQTDTFYTVTNAVVVSGGADYAIGDTITLETAPSTDPPIGAPVVLTVTSVDVLGAVLAATVVPIIIDSDPSEGGSYFARQTNPQSQGSTTGNGTGATFNLTYAGPAPQRVVLTSQEFATLVYCRDNTDINRMDDMFQDAWSKLVGATVTMALTGDKKLANDAIGLANSIIQRARTGDGNEGFTINDVTPDWIRIRGINFIDPNYSGPYIGFDWGGLWSTY